MLEMTSLDGAKEPHGSRTADAYMEPQFSSSPNQLFCPFLALTGQREGWELGNLLLSMSALDAKPCVEGIGQQRAEA